MPYQINRAALDDFLARQVDILERTPVPDEVVQLVAGEDETLSADELRAVWLGAGLATHVGLALLEQPERFIRATASTA
ncbi:MAG TPA: hypothetical protein VGO31_01045 [Microbacteriaceae bacterium]|jgi:hypothetical protein|nr:hypothetical protein [Microbacteriaceae bacterium]